MGKMYGNEGISFFGKIGVELYAVEFFLKGLGNKRTSLVVMDKAPDSIRRTGQGILKQM